MREPSEQARQAAREGFDAPLEGMRLNDTRSRNHQHLDVALDRAYAEDFPARDGDLRERVARAIARAAGAKCFELVDGGSANDHWKQDCEHFRRLADAALGEVGAGAGLQEARDKLQGCVEEERREAAEMPIPDLCEARAEAYENAVAILDRMLAAGLSPVGNGEARLRKALEEIAALDGGYPDDYCEIARKALDAGSSPSPAEPLDRVLEAVADCWLAGIATTAIIDAIRFHERDSAADSGSPSPSPAEKECPEPGCGGTGGTYIECPQCGAVGGGTGRVPSSPADEVTVSREDAAEIVAWGKEALASWGELSADEEELFSRLAALATRAARNEKRQG